MGLKKKDHLVYGTHINSTYDDKIFGCKTHAFIAKEMKKKLNFYSKKIKFVGYSTKSAKDSYMIIQKERRSFKKKLNI